MGLNEEAVVSKVEELMDALDNAKKYTAFAKSLKSFALILLSSIILYIIARSFFSFFEVQLALSNIWLFIILFSFVLIPIIGFVISLLYVKRKVDRVVTGEWRQNLSSQGFPAAVQILMELDWERTFDEISIGKLGYMSYGVIKVVGYWFVTFFILERISNLYTLLTSSSVPLFIADLLPAVSAALIVFLLLGKDLLRRYRESQSLNILLWELRGLDVELKRATI